MQSRTIRGFLLRTLTFTMAPIFVFSSACVGAYAVDDGSGYLLVTDYVAANSGVDVSAQIQSVIDSNPNRTIFFPDGEYLVSQPILTPAEPRKSVSLKLADYAVIKACGDWPKGEAVVQLGGKLPANNTDTNGSNYALDGGIIDGSGVANGVSINSGRETVVRNTSIKHTVIGLHIKPGANSNSSDCDISGLNIIGTYGTDSIGILLEGYDNTLTNIRIGSTFIGVYLKSSGNVLRNIHPLYRSDYTDYQNSCGFLEENGDNWYDFCYSDQYGIGFRTVNSTSSIYNDCFCYWYSSKGETLTAFKADKRFKATLTNFKVGFREDTENHVLTVGDSVSNGTFDNLHVDESRVSDKSYKAYCKDEPIISRIWWLMVLVFETIFS